MEQRKWAEGDVCAVCPALKLGVGEFDVAASPGPESRYDRVRDHRVNTVTGAPTCVHPFRVQLPPGAYASEGVPAPVRVVPVPASGEALELPESPDDLEAWFLARLSVAGDGEILTVLREAEAVALRRFGSRDVAETLRRVLGLHLVGRGGSDSGAQSPCDSTA